MALAHSWRDRGGVVTFVTACGNERLLRHLQDAANEVLPLRQPHPDPDDQEALLRVLAIDPEAWVALDGYHFDSGYQARVRQTGHRLLVIDDIAHLERYTADVILNQNILAEQLVYYCNPDASLLLGTRYALLRPEFLLRCSWQRDTRLAARHILVTLGGSDPDNVTLKVLRALRQLDRFPVETRIVVGPASEHLEELEAAVRILPGETRILVDVNDMPDLMAWADLAVSAGGSTCWELAFMGLPNVVVVLSDDQRGIGDGLAAEGIALNLGWHEKVTEDQIAEALGGLVEDRPRREAMSARGRQLVDGRGAERVVAALLGKVG